MSARILVIDDAATVRLYHRKLLQQAGWEVEEAGNGVEALEKVLGQAQGQDFHLYVVDVNMPKLDGYSFVRELRTLPDVPQVPVLMVSTEAGQQDSAAACAAGANAYLVKPARPAVLVLVSALLLGDVLRARGAAAMHLASEVRA